jgi:hypothetical protein
MICAAICVAFPPFPSRGGHGRQAAPGIPANPRLIYLPARPKSIRPLRGEAPLNPPGAPLRILVPILTNNLVAPSARQGKKAFSETLRKNPVRGKKKAPCVTIPAWNPAYPPLPGGFPFINRPDPYVEGFERMGRPRALTRKSNQEVTIL